MTIEPAGPDAVSGEARIRWLDSFWTDAQLEAVVAKYNTYDEEIVIGRWFGDAPMSVQTPAGLENRMCPAMKLYIGMRNPLFAGGPESRWLWYWLVCNANEDRAKLEIGIASAIEECRKARTIQNGPLGKKKGNP